MTVTKPPPEKPDRTIEEWDAEIEAEFQRVTKASPKGDVSEQKKWRRHSTTVPREWELRLRWATRISTYRLALELLYLRWRADHDKFQRVGEPVIVSHEVMAEAGLTRQSARRALSQLEKLGLIEVDRTNGRAARAALLHIPTK
jgi:hypothetical protein